MVAVWVQKVRAGEEVSTQELLKFAKLFNDELTLDNLERWADIIHGSVMAGVSGQGSANPD